MTHDTDTMFPEKIRKLCVSINGSESGVLIRESQYVYSYDREYPEQLPVGLFLSPDQMVHRSSDLFSVMDQNLPEGYLFQRIKDFFPKQKITDMHLLALIGDNGIGRLGFHLQGEGKRPSPPAISRDEILNSPDGVMVFDNLVRHYLSSGIGISGVQPKIMVPERATVPIPNLIVKAGSDEYEDQACNEFVCMSAAKNAQIRVPEFDLSHDGKMLVLDRFDVTSDHQRLGFEDVASLFGLHVRDRLSDRKYHGSYEDIATLLLSIGLPREDLEEFFTQVAFSVMVRNGDAHMKNFGVLYRSRNDIRLAPMYDVLTTAIYKYEKFGGGPIVVDNTLALRLMKQSRTKGYPTRKDLLSFGHLKCQVKKPELILDRIAQAMNETLAQMKQDERIPRTLLDKLAASWSTGLMYSPTPSRLR